MDIFEQHELFEIEVLDGLKNNHFLNNLVFGGGTMLRLCYELNRYSVDLDFFSIREFHTDKFFLELRDFLQKRYEITDANIKRNTLLFEMRSPNYPRKLKLEIRKEIKNYDFQQRIAFSKFSSTQVVLNVLTLEQALKNKIAAALDRKIIRDFFDIEFIIKQGVDFSCTFKELKYLKKIIAGFSKRDYKVTLGSILEKEQRDYYIENGFAFLNARLNAALAS